VRREEVDELLDDEELDVVRVEEVKRSVSEVRTIELVELVVVTGSGVSLDVEVVEVVLVVLLVDTVVRAAVVETPTARSFLGDFSLSRAKKGTNWIHRQLHLQHRHQERHLQAIDAFARC
jgi:hypothetical protein